MEPNPDTPQDEQHEARVVALGSSFSGPLPPPAILEKYDQVLPGLADRIVTMAEKEELHRHEMEQRSLQSEVELQNKALEMERETIASEMREARWGQVFAFLIGSLTIGTGAYLALHDAQIPGTILGSGGVVGLVSVFIYGRKGQKKETLPEKKDQP